MELCWKRRGCSCLVTYGKYLGLAGFLGRWAVLVCGITILETVFFTAFYYYYWETIGELVWVDFLWGSWLRRRSVQIEPGKAACSFVFCLTFFFETCYNNSSPLGDTACGSVLFGSSFRCSDEHASPLCYWIFPLSVWEKKTNVWLLYRVFLFFLFLFCEAYWSGLWEDGKAIYEQWDLVLRVGLFKGIFSGFSIHIWSRPFSVLLQIFMELLAVLEQRIDVIRGILFGACVWFRYRGLKAYRTRIYECLNKRFICLVMFVCLSLYRGKAIQHPFITQHSNCNSRR